MPSAKVLLLALLACVAAVFCVVWGRELFRRRAWSRPSGFEGLVGFVTNFFDTLGIGSFATTTSLYRLHSQLKEGADPVEQAPCAGESRWFERVRPFFRRAANRAVADEKIPGTLNVGHTIPTITQAFIYITFVEVEMTTLVLLIGASTLGAWLGAGVVTRLPRRRIQIGMGLALLAAAVLILGRLLNVFSSGGEALGLQGDRLAAAIVGNFVLGALMTIGIGAYAPIMIMVSLLGMNPKAAFPIMMGSCAFLMPIAGVRFIRTEKYDAAAALGLTLGGIPAVLLAGLLVKELPLDVVRWLVVVVVLYTGVSLLRAARSEKNGSV